MAWSPCTIYTSGRWQWTKWFSLFMLLQVSEFCKHPGKSHSFAWKASHFSSFYSSPHYPLSVRTTVKCVALLSTSENPPTFISGITLLQKCIRKDTNVEIHLFTSWKATSCQDVLGFESKLFPQSPLLDQVEMRSDSGFRSSASLTTQPSRSSPTSRDVGGWSLKDRERKDRLERTEKR